MKWRVDEKDYYLPKKCQFNKTPQAPYFKIKGKGNPNSECFQVRVQALYKLSYAIRMSYKNEMKPENYEEYVVFPLEGDWSFTKAGIVDYEKTETVNKDELVYTLMIRQPDFVTKDVFNKFKKHLIAKTDDLPHLDEIYYEVEKPQNIMQKIHIGSFDGETETIKKMENCAIANGKNRTSKDHRETYLSDPRKTSEDKLKTLLSFHVK